MEKIIVLLAVIVASFGTSTAQVERMTLDVQGPAKWQGQSGSWSGYLIDANLGGNTPKNPGVVKKKAAEYQKSTALENGSSVGFGILADGKWYKFNAEGDKQALDIIKNSKKEKGFYVTVTGKLEDEIIAVTSIQESAGDSSPQINN